MNRRPVNVFGGHVTSVILFIIFSNPGLIISLSFISYVRPGLRKLKKDYNGHRLIFLFDWGSILIINIKHKELTPQSIEIL